MRTLGTILVVGLFLANVAGSVTCTAMFGLFPGVVYGLATVLSAGWTADIVRSLWKIR
jgi:hypothetical protein